MAGPDGPGQRSAPCNGAGARAGAVPGDDVEKDLIVEHRRPRDKGCGDRLFDLAEEVGNLERRRFERRQRPGDRAQMLVGDQVDVLEKLFLESGAILGRRRAQPREAFGVLVQHQSDTVVRHDRRLAAKR